MMANHNTASGGQIVPNVIMNPIEVNAETNTSNISSI